MASGEVDGLPVLSRIDANIEGGDSTGKPSGRKKRSGSNHVPAIGNASARDPSGSIHAPDVEHL